MSNDVRSAHSSNGDSGAAGQELAEQLSSGPEPRLIVFFHSPNHDGRKIADALHAKFPNARVAGGSASGEFSDRAYTQGGANALALTDGKLEELAATVISVDGDVHQNVHGGVLELSRQLGKDLRELDPSKYVGLIIVDSARMKEEQVNEALGNECPLLSFVGGSATDGGKFEKSFVHTETKTFEAGAVLLVLRLKGAFQVVKTCNFEATDVLFTVTKSDPSKRLILELNGRPAAQVYAEAIGAQPDKLDLPTCLFHPLGLMIEGKPWLRSVVKGMGDALFCACAVPEGMQLRLMKNRDIVDDTRKALQAAAQQLGAQPSGGLLFNCMARMVEVQVKKSEAPYYGVFKDFPVAGFHAAGESWLGHLNQTLTGLLFA